MLGEDEGDLDSLHRWYLKGGTQHKRRQDLTSCRRGKKSIFLQFHPNVVATTSEKGEAKWSCNCKL